MIQQERIHAVNQNPLNLKNEYVLYWMQQSQRESYNHALEFSIDLANQTEKALLVVFVLAVFPEANKRHYCFMLEGLIETKKALEKRNLQFIFKVGNPAEIISDLAKKSVALIFDKGYLRVQKEWRNSIAAKTKSRIYEVESDVIIPTLIVSRKEEYSARTIRGKINERISDYLVPLKRRKLNNHKPIPQIVSADFSDIESTLRKMQIDNSVERVRWITGGTKQAGQLLSTFLDTSLDYYASSRNDPDNEYQSDLSPYLHFGQISALDIVLKLEKVGSPGRAAFFEQLVIRRELSMNFVENNPDYDTTQCLPNWALKTLHDHIQDKREYLYTRAALEESKTHDTYWNTAQLELVKSGKMHGYMRMYWGKKIIEWSKTPELAFLNALYLNNKYALDGRDANSFAGVAWCFGKHDRAWNERPIFGKIRYMNDKGLERKFNLNGYIQRIKHL